MSNEQKLLSISRAAETDQTAVRILPHLLSCIERGETTQLPEGAMIPQPERYQVDEAVYSWSPGISDALQHLYGVPAEYTTETIRFVFSWMENICNTDSQTKLSETIDMTREMVRFQNAIYYEDIIDLYYSYCHENMNHDNVYEFARFLIETAADTEILKLGLILMRYYMGLYLEQTDQLHALGITEEFTYFVVELLKIPGEIGNEEQKLNASIMMNRIIKETSGWGKTLALRAAQEKLVKNFESQGWKVEKAFTNTTDDNALVCSKTFASWMKQEYQKDVETPVDNLDMILRYCGPWSEEFFEEKNRQIHDFNYTLKLEDGKISMAPSYPLTRLFAEDPVDFEGTPEYPGFEERMPLLTTAAAFPGKQQVLKPQQESWKLRFLLDEVLHIAKEFREKPAYEDHFARREFYQAAAPEFIDNQMPYSYGPSCPDRLLSYVTYRNVLIHFLKGFDQICTEAGIQMEHEGLFVVALCAAWYDRMKRHGIRYALTLEVPLEELLERAEMFYHAEVESCGEDADTLADYTQAVQEVKALTTQNSIIDPPAEGDEQYLTQNAREAALRNREGALGEYLTPMERTERDTAAGRTKRVVIKTDD